MFDRITPVNRALIIANVGIYGLQLLLRPVVENLFILWPSALQNGHFQVWRLLTYGFLHGGPAHLFFNMFALFMFGSAIENVFGARRYLAYYLVSVAGAGLLHLIVIASAGLPPVPILGASGGIMAVLLAYGMFFPQQQLIIFPIPVPIRAWAAVILYGAFDLVMGVSQTNTGIAHFAHLGGLLTGFVLIRYWTAQRRRPRN